MGTDQFHTGGVLAPAARITKKVKLGENTTRRRDRPAGVGVLSHDHGGFGRRCFE
jgi:hypothetical protein